MTKFLLFPLIWLVLGAFAGLISLLEFKLKNIKLSRENKIYYFKQGLIWGAIGFVIAFRNLSKLLRSL